MADQPHDIRDLVSGDDTASLALATDLGGHEIFVGFEYGSLMQTNG